MHLSRILTLCLLALALPPAWAGPDKGDVPDTVYPFRKVTEAIAQAKATGKPLMYVYTGVPGVGCDSHKSLCVRALKAATEGAVVVHVRSSDWGRLPEQVQAALDATVCGSRVPRSAVFTSDNSVALASLKYNYYVQQQYKAAIAETAPKAGTGTGYGPARSNSAATPDDAVPEIERLWTDSRGRSVRALCVEVKDASVVLLDGDGKTLEIPVDKLSYVDRQYVQNR